jgi:ribonucleoside-diphosphate reductase alpha chain
MVDIYSAAWERGVKTTYYLHMKPRHQAEQSTVRVNKSEEISGGARKGFGAAAAQASAPAPAAEPAGAGAPARRGFGFGGLSSSNNDSEGK